MAKPFVSVLIDTYNHERFIENAIVSVLEQDFPAPDREILVVDDGSTDHTPEILHRFAPQVRVLRKANGGQASAFNAGIPECRGEIIAFLDGDDWWAPQKLSCVNGVFEAHPEVGMVGHGTFYCFADGRQQTEIITESPRFSLTSVEGARLFRTRKSFLGTRSTIRAGVLKRLLPVPETIRIEADEFVFTMAAAFGEVYVLPEALLFYRLHSGNLYSQHGFNVESVKRKQHSIAQLAENLTARLRAVGIAEDVLHTVVDAILVESDQLRLSVGEGYPWETVKTELAMYRLLHSDAPWAHRAFKYATLLPAYFLPPQAYYGARRRLAASDWYRRSREVFFPVPQPKHVTRSWKTGA